MNKTNDQLMDALAKKFLRTFEDWEKKIYKDEVIDKIDNKIFNLIYEEIIQDKDIKYFPRPIDFERLEYRIRHKGYGF